MFRRQQNPEDDAPRRGPPDKTLSSKIAWGVLALGGALIVARMSVATVVQIHGDGMAPTILDGEHIMLVRGEWSVEPGDVVIYDPTPAALPSSEDAPEDPLDPNGGRDSPTPPDPDLYPTRDIRNTAVVDVEELEENWEKVQRKSGGLASSLPRPRAFRVGRVLAVPGDHLTFFVPDSPLGLAVNGVPVKQKLADPLRVRLRGEVDPQKPPEEMAATLRSTAFEQAAARRYQVLLPADDKAPGWLGMGLPDAASGQVELVAEGYLVLADNRDEGACCDSRAIGLVPAGQIRGEVVARLAGDPSATPDLGEEARGLRWAP